MLRRKKGFTLIELLIVIAIIGILAAIAIPLYKAQTIKAKLTEVTNSMSSVASSVGAWYSDERRWPPACVSAAAIQNTLGVALPVGTIGGNAPRIGAMTTDAVGSITATISANIDGDVTNKTITLTPTTGGGGAITWSWGGTIGRAYLPTGGR